MEVKSLPADAAAETTAAAPASATADQARGAWRPTAERLGQRYGTIVILALLFVYFAVKTDNGVFTTRDNLSSILQSSAVLGIVAAGLTLVLVIGAFDLSIAGNLVLATLLAAKIAVDSGSTDLGMLIAVGVAGAVGLANGLIVTVLRVPPFIGTLAMGLFILVGFQQKIAPDGTVSLGLPENFGDLGQGEVFGVRYTVLIAALVLLVAHFLLKHTVLGRHMYAVGGGADAARLAGIRVDVVRVIAFTLCGLACGLGGFLTASTFGLGSAQAGGSILLDAFTACFIGASTLTIGRFHMIGTTLGVLTLGMLTNGLTLTGWTSDDVPIAKGVILIVAVAAAGLLRRRQ
ncbi:ABC transporter permease [Nocardioides islandensis]|uniref:ABC transporter permease n=1 Tax=Nocardioides islandensis TaxID=433663 RepID=A0A930YF04_9ACTN|nr:ABC transporter permease [Nocardioides islandensis]MBF4764382.1 ABC transporter permease [Nocardioides islandensis]